MPERHVTSDEFNRYVGEEANFRSRLEQRLAADHKQVRDDLGEIKGLVRETNGRVLTAEKLIGILQRDVDAMKAEENDIERVVNSIKDEGCDQYREHRAVLDTVGQVTGRPQFTLDHFSPRQKVVAGAGIALVMWPALQEIASVVHDLVLWLQTHP